MRIKIKMKLNSNKKIAILQIIVLAVAIFAFAYVIGDSFEVVSGGGCAGETDLCNPSKGNFCCEGLICAEKNAKGEGFCVREETQEPQTQKKEKPFGLKEVYTMFSLTDMTLRMNDKLNLFGKTGTKDINPNVIVEQGTKTGIGDLGETGGDWSGFNNIGPQGGDALEIVGEGESAKFAVPSEKPISFLETTVGRILGAYASAFAAAYGYVAIFKIAGASNRNVHALSNTAWIVGAGAGTAALVLAKTGATAAIFKVIGVVGAGVPGVGWVAAAIAVIAMAAYTAFSYQKYSQDIFTYTVNVWQPPEGGKNCLDCNKLRYGCSEYQCHSFGEGCEIINNGTSYEKCAWSNPNDKLPPEIAPMQGVLEDDYKYLPINVVTPGDKGVRIIYTGENSDQKGCIPPFTNLILGANTSEPAECKIDIERGNAFNDMLGYFVQGSANVYNHTMLLPSSSMPSQSALENANWSVEHGATHTFYIKCKDHNGNQNPMDFIMTFCVQDGPDTMAPIIESTTYSTESGQSVFVQYNETTVPLEVYTNEPADCRWDFLDLDYSAMNYNMSDCSQNIGDFLYPSTFTYGCKTNLTGMKNKQDTTYYIKCKDQPWLVQAPGKRNANKDSYILTLKGTHPLQIDEITINNLPNGSTIMDSTDVIKVTLKVKTSAGAHEGDAKCQYAVDGIYYDFFNDGSFDFTYENTQDLWLSEGEYIYPIMCWDQGGNTIHDNAFFTVETDISAPEIVRVYYEEGYLKLITNEEAQCVYSDFGRDYAFEDGTEITVIDEINHFIAWTTENDLFVKCRDKYGNLPVPQDSCNIVVRGSEFYSG